jgi:peroxiredoxin
MAVESTAAQSGAPCPDFRLPAVDGKTYGRDDFASAPVLVVMFICNHCPYVKAVEDRIIALHREYGPQGVALVGICANDAVSYPDDAFDKLAERWRAKGYGFPYLHDESQAVAHAFGAVCTPDIFVYDGGGSGDPSRVPGGSGDPSRVPRYNRRLAYRGRIDDSWKDASKVTRRELAGALDALLEGRAPPGDARPTLGCSIKWK